MRPIVQGLKNVGADNSTIQFAIRTIVIALVLVALGALGLNIYEVIKGLAISPWAASITTGIAFFFGVIVVQQHTASTIDGSNAKSVAAAQQSLQPSIDNSNANVQQLLQILATTLQEQQKQNASVIASAVPATSNTHQAIAENTQATIENTQATKQVDSDLQQRST